MNEVPPDPDFSLCLIASLHLDSEEKMDFPHTPFTDFSLPLINPCSSASRFVIGARSGVSSPISFNMSSIRDLISLPILATRLPL